MLLQRLVRVDNGDATLRLEGNERIAIETDEAHTDCGKNNLQGVVISYVQISQNKSNIIYPASQTDCSIQ